MPGVGYDADMHIDVVPNRNSRPAYLLRESYRVGDKVKKRTLANLSSLSDEQIAALRIVLQGRPLVPADSVFEVLQSRQHGQAMAVSVAMYRLGIADLLGSRSSRQRSLVLAMIAARIIAPATKLATTRWWHGSTLVEDLGVADANEDAVYAAMDWLLERQDSIERRLAKRHLPENGVVLYDLSSSYFEGSHCPLAKLGYSRDGKPGMLQVNYGLMTDVRGCPVAVSVFPGNTADPSTLMPQVRRLKDDFALAQLVLVGDRGMISGKAITQLRDEEGIDWITALKSGSIRRLVDQGVVQPGLFDEHNLFEFDHLDYPDERLIACRNPQLAKLRAHKRQDLLSATERHLEPIRQRVKAGRLSGQDKIGVAVGKVLNKYKMGKHFQLEIEDQALRYSRKTEAIAAEAALDGIYIIRTSVKAERMDDADCVRHYKALANVERAFRTLKSVDLKIRPIHHRLEPRVRAHIFLCMLAYYVEWHMREAWRELLFADEDQAAKRRRDPVAPAERSDAALAKIATRKHNDGTPIHSFATLMADLGSIVRNTCQPREAAANSAKFDLITTPNTTQARALQLLEGIKPTAATQM